MKVIFALLLSLVLLAPLNAFAAGGGNGNGNGNGNANGDGNGNGSNGNSGNGHAYGKDKGDDGSDSSAILDDQNAALAAVQSGAALPLSQIIALATRRWGGHVIDAALVLAQGTLLYQLTMISDQGVSRRVFCDARSGQPVDTP
jgi:hypothetical protein